MGKYTKSTIKIFFHHAAKYKWLIFFTIFCVTSATAIQSIVPIYYKKFFDTLTSSGSDKAIFDILISILVIIAVLELVSWFFWRCSGFLNNYVQPKVMKDLATRCYAYLHKHSFGFFNDNFVGSIVKRVNRFVFAFEVIADNIIWYLTGLFVNTTVILVVLFYRKWQLGLIILSWVFLFLIINVILAKYKLKYDIVRNEAETKASGFLADTVTNHNNVKLFSGYKKEVKSFSNLQEKVRSLRNFTWNLDTIFEAGQTFLMIVLEIGIMYAAIIYWQRGFLTLGDFVLIQAYIFAIFRHVWNFGRTLRAIYQHLADA
ncbi:MAG: hypothetical protein GF349_00005, partial [Candidatus Magasanikbacteria bacterium]|nr:hypothetical protein [Candidatus Magasanikbacteria bacterium]